MIDTCYEKAGSGCQEVGEYQTACPGVGDIAAFHQEDYWSYDAVSWGQVDQVLPEDWEENQWGEWIWSSILFFLWFRNGFLLQGLEFWDGKVIAGEN